LSTLLLNAFAVGTVITKITLCSNVFLFYSIGVPCRRSWSGATVQRGLQQSWCTAWQKSPKRLPNQTCRNSVPADANAGSWRTIMTH